MSDKLNIVVMGASYGSLLATKLLLAGHGVKLLCLPEEANLINTEGTIVRMPVRGRDGLVEVRSRDLPGSLSAGGTSEIDPAEYDLIGLAMQEPQYRSPGMREFLERVAKSATPCLSIMNMPPLPYLTRIPRIDVETCRACYTDPSVWDSFDPKLVTLCSPDPQAFRPPEDKVNVLQVGLSTNFKAARFEDDAHTEMLRGLERDIQEARFEIDGKESELPVKLRVHDSVFVPLAKWAMLIAGNYRCVQKDEIRTIKEAVHSDLDQSREIYHWVVKVCTMLGANESDLVPFENYANAAESLVRPSAAARALAAGAPNIERVDCLVKTIAAKQGETSHAVAEIVALVDHWLDKNRAKGAFRSA